ncbi:MAG: hypothetical protein V7637_6272 [Mycobacteriales bacterium]
MTQPAGGTRAARAVVAALIAVAALSLVALAARSGRTETLTPIMTASGTPTPTATQTGAAKTAGSRAASDQPADSSIAGGIIVAALGAALLLSLVLALLMRRRRARGWAGLGRAFDQPVPDLGGSGRPATGAAQALAGAVDAALRRLEEGESADAVIACWVSLERVAAEAGTARRPAETPTELTTRVLAQHHVTADPLHRLADLYRTARYSTHPLGEDARDQARAALDRVRRELAGEPVGEPL